MDFVAFMEDNVAIVWFIFGLALLAAEMLVPGVYLLWLGGAAVMTSSIVYFAGDFGFVGNMVIFVGMSIISILFANRTAYAQAQEPGEGEVNLRGGQHIGRSYEVIEPIKNGRGRIQVADSNWLAEGPDCGKGTMVRVTAVDGSMMRVELANGD